MKPLSEKVFNAKGTCYTGKVIEACNVAEAVRRLKELTKSWIFGEGPFMINEDNIDEYLKELNEIFGEMREWG